jgi:hypothetical protein
MIAQKISTVISVECKQFLLHYRLKRFLYQKWYYTSCRKFFVYNFLFDDKKLVSIQVFYFCLEKPTKSCMKENLDEIYYACMQCCMQAFCTQ